MPLAGSEPATPASERPPGLVSKINSKQKHELIKIACMSVWYRLYRVTSSMIVLFLMSFFTLILSAVSVTAQWCTHAHGGNEESRILPKFCETFRSPTAEFICFYVQTRAVALCLCISLKNNRNIFAL